MNQQKTSKPAATAVLNRVLRYMLHYYKVPFTLVVLCIIITVITLVSGLQVVCRYLFNNSLTWSEEVSRYLFVWTGFLTLSLSIKCRSIISIDAFVLWMPRRVRAGLNMVVYLFCSVVFAML